MARPQSKAPDVRAVFAGRLREARAARRWTQQDLADALGRLGAPMDRTTIAKLEKGQREVRLTELIAIAAALDVAPVHLFLPINGKAPVRLAPKLVVDIVHARSWARGRRPLDPANVRFYSFQSPGDIGVSMEGATAEAQAEALAELTERLSSEYKTSTHVVPGTGPSQADFLGVTPAVNPKEEN